MWIVLKETVHKHVGLYTANKEVLVTVAPPGFCNRGEVRYGSIGGLEYEFPSPG